MLKIKSVSKSFEGIKAVNSLNMILEKKGIYGLIGPNGSGKTTLFNLISGFLPIDSGEIFYRGIPIHEKKPYQIYNMGLARTFQLTRIFPKMTVIENMMVPPKNQKGEKIFNLFLNKRKVIDQEINIRNKAMDLLNFVGLFPLRNELGKNLSYGQQKLLELARILMGEPEMILLDEPTAGVNPTMIRNLMEMIEKLSDIGKSFLIVEHNIDVVIELCRWVYVLDHGEKIAEGRPNEIKSNEKVIEAYLGV
ncbi:MAG: ABC transporter ATP-binding protein [Spirochaetes bacterium]|nr:ABC transporter ATP-binding protein [Deltaproteobacteria bacterium]RKY01114.1 MAG: ABC transporter ATP-binding protein [Spirochaetota bacterium]